MFENRKRLTVKEVKAELSDAIKVRKVGNNTFNVEYANGNKAVRYHHTDVITETAAGEIILSSGGYRTPTTKDRLNNHAPFPARFWQDRGIWSGNVFGGKSVMFYDGMIFDRQGNLLSEEKSPDFPRINRIKKQVSGFVKLITKDNLPLPDNGDCWLCLLADKDKKPWGENDNNHLQSHIDEGYLHGSLLVNAMRERGYDDISIRLHYQMKLVDTFRRALRRYLLKRFLPDIATK